MSCAGYYQGFKPDSLPAVPGLEGADRNFQAATVLFYAELGHAVRHVSSAFFDAVRCTRAGVGRVEANGEGASKFSKGQRVISFNWGALKGNGTWQQYRVVPEKTLIAVADSVSDTSAAQAIVNPVTVVGFVEVRFFPTVRCLS